jgi:hypothetical protein
LCKRRRIRVGLIAESNDDQPYVWDICVSVAGQDRDTVALGQAVLECDLRLPSLNREFVAYCGDTITKGAGRLWGAGSMLSTAVFIPWWARLGRELPSPRRGCGQAGCDALIGGTQLVCVEKGPTRLLDLRRTFGGESPRTSVARWWSERFYCWSGSIASGLSTSWPSPQRRR